MNKTVSILLAIGALVALVVGTSIVLALNSEDPLKDEKELLIKMSDPEAINKSTIEEFNNIDKQADKLYKQARSQMRDGDLEVARQLLHQAIDNYDGFQGHHYMAIVAALSKVYKRQGDREKYKKYASQSMLGSLEMIKLEKEKYK